jgi:hypothetical protein
MYEEIKLSVYDLMKSKIVQVKFSINKWCNLDNITQWT